jgi:ribulose-phosphate 3-epimerase
MSQNKILIAPSILSADFRNLEKEIKSAEEAGADYIHCDVMDGHFVPNISFGPLVVNAVRKITRLPLDVHLMIEKPEKYISAFRDAGADIITVHAEACGKNLSSVLKEIGALGVKAGVCVNPDKPIDLFLPYLDLVNMVLIMTVFAGFGGQKFIVEMLPKISALKSEITKRKLNIDIEVDGGINDKTIHEAVKAGANIIVAGSYVFGAKDYKEKIRSLRV